MKGNPVSVMTTDAAPAAAATSPQPPAAAPVPQVVLVQGGADPRPFWKRPETHWDAVKWIVLIIVPLILSLGGYLLKLDKRETILETKMDTIQTDVRTTQTDVKTILSRLPAPR